MIRPIIITLGIALAASSSAAGTLSDADLSKRLVGSWITPPDSPDYGPQNKYAVETYGADGSDATIFYADSACKKIVGRTNTSWTVENGIVVTIVPNGRKLRDEIVSIEGDTVTVHSLDTGTTYKEMKGTICDGPPVSGCAPKPGEGARWIVSCETAAKAGDGRAAIMTGEIYWNGDGVQKDDASAAIYWRMADQAGEPEAAYLLGTEAFVRSGQTHGICFPDPPALAEAVGWYQKAIKVELDPKLRQQAQTNLDLLLIGKNRWPPECRELAKPN